MKKLLSLILAFGLMLTLCACKSKEVKDAEALIGAIGEVTLDSEVGILAAEAAVAALSEEDRAAVENAAVLAEARTAYDALYHNAFSETLVCRWVNEVMGDMYYNALEDTDCAPVNDYAFYLEENGVCVVNGEEGSWTLSADLKTITIDVAGEQSTVRVMEEDGFVKLVGEVGGNHAFGYVAEENYDAAFAAKYAAVELRNDNLKDTVGEPVSMGVITHPTAGQQVDTFFFPSKMYDKGFVYLGCSNCSVDLKCATNKGTKTLAYDFPVFMCTLASEKWNISLGQEALGAMFYIKDDYVVKNYISDEGYRTLDLTNGITVRFDGYGQIYDFFWTYVDADYSEYIY